MLTINYLLRYPILVKNIPAYEIYPDSNILVKLIFEKLVLTYPKNPRSSVVLKRSKTGENKERNFKEPKFGELKKNRTNLELIQTQEKTRREGRRARQLATSTALSQRRGVSLACRPRGRGRSRRTAAVCTNREQLCGPARNPRESPRDSARVR